MFRCVAPVYAASLAARTLLVPGRVERDTARCGNLYRYAFEMSISKSQPHSCKLPNPSPNAAHVLIFLEKASPVPSQSYKLPQPGRHMPLFVQDPMRHKALLPV